MGLCPRSLDPPPCVQVGNLDTPVDEEMVWELLTQAAPVQSVHLPRDRITNAHQARSALVAAVLS